MKAKGICITLLSLCVTTTVQAETPQGFVASYAAEAGRDFTPSAQRGGEFFKRNHGISKDMPNCTSCHTRDMRTEGRHVITGKRIAPLSPAVNTERFTDPKKVEKWFRRNCTEVVGRECTAAEKADFIEFARQGG